MSHSQITTSVLPCLKLPSRWELRRLKFVSDVQISNVDKKSVEDERSVKLCNYVDVYKNDVITPDMEFMEATATDAQIENFSLQEGDVLITKDSESWDDIAIPAVVSTDLPGVVCGYHLAHIRPYPTVLDGRYLARCFSARGIAEQFFLAANGITRFGLGKDEITGGLFPIPPLATQQRIAAYLDRETSRIDALIAAKERLLELLAEKSRALITHTVTRGLNLNAKLKDSGLPWLGMVPESWEVKRSKLLLKERDQRSETGEEELLTVSHITGVTPRAEKDVTMFEAETTEGYKVCKAGDLAINTMWAFMGAMGISPVDGIVSPAYNVYKPTDEYDPQYLDMLVRIPHFCEEVRRYSKGVWSSRLRLYPEGLYEIRLPLPPKSEQASIVAELERHAIRTDAIEAVAKESVVLLRERRSALIAAVVTGQVQVGGVNDQ